MWRNKSYTSKWQLILDVYVEAYLSKNPHESDLKLQTRRKVRGETLQNLIYFEMSFQVVPHNC